MLSKWLILLCFIPAALFAQETSFSFRNININEGLSQSSVVDIELDQAGFIWFATQDGLNKFDGKRFEIFPKTFDDVTTLTGSRLGKLVSRNANELWMVSSGGRLEVMNLHSKVIRQLTRIGKDSLQLPPVSSLVFDGSGNMWIGTEENGIFVVDQNDNVERIHRGSRPAIPANQVRMMYADRNKNIWVVSTAGLTRIKAGSTRVSANFQAFADHALSSVAEDPEGNLWFGTYGKGIQKFDIKSNSFIAGTTLYNSLPPNLVIEDILIDRTNKIWIGTYGDGLFVIDIGNGGVRHFVSNRRNPKSLAYNDVLSLKEDSYGSIWIGTDGGGVSLFSPRLNYFKEITSNVVPDDVSVEQVRSIATDRDGGIWIGTSNSGLAYANINQRKFAAFNFKPYAGVISNYQRIVSLHADNNNHLWVGSQGNGLILLNRRESRIEKILHPDAKGDLFIPDHTIWCLIEADNESVWVGSRQARLFLVNKSLGLLKSFQFSKELRPDILDNNLRAIARINDSILALGFEKGDIGFFNTRTERFSKPSPVLDSLTSSGTILKTLFYKDSRLWIGTLGKGLYCYDLKTLQLTHITELQGLPNNTIYSILPDADNRLWMSTNNGLCRFQPPADITRTSRSNFVQFTVEDGLQSNEFNTGASHQAADGRLFFGGINGLNYFNPGNVESFNKVPRVLITQASINNTPYSGDTSISYKKSLILSHPSNSLSFDFTALDFVTPFSYDYYYQMQGYDESWIESGKRNYAAYTNLPPGDYVFNVMASKGIFSSENPVSSLHIKVRPPFWKTWWFLSLCILSAGLILYAIYRYRIRQILKLQAIRNRIATDLHDDIGSALTNISLLSELSKSSGANGNSLFLDRISEEVHSSSQALDDIVWSINANNDSLDQTVARMRRYAAEIFDGANIHYTLEFADEFAERRLNMELRRDCFLIFKEAINNIYKHANARNVNIKLWIEKNHLMMTIKDDGVGFDVTRSTHRNGIKNIRQRAERWKGVVSISATEGHGTLMRIEFSGLS